MCMFQLKGVIKTGSETWQRDQRDVEREETPDVFLLNQCKYKIMKEVRRKDKGRKEQK